MSSIKMGSRDARELARLLWDVARPRTPAEVAEVLRWVKRLEGQ